MVFAVTNSLTTFISSGVKPFAIHKPFAVSTHTPILVDATLTLMPSHFTFDFVKRNFYMPLRFPNILQIFQQDL